MVMLRRFLTEISYTFICGLVFNFMFFVPTNASDDVMADRAMIDLAYSEGHYRNVGALYKIYTYPSCVRRVKTATVVYMGGKSCVTNAHCFKTKLGDLDNYFLTGHQVSFELLKGVHTFFDIADYVVHPDYQPCKYSDIAMICLNATVDGLSGLMPVYSFGKDECYTVDPERNQLTCIGYGHSGDDDSSFIRNDSYRRALQTELFYAQVPDHSNEIPWGSMQNKCISSLPYKADLKLVAKDEAKIVPRNRFSHESLMRQGMSGGAMLYNGDFVGINAKMFYGLSSAYDHAMQYILSYTNPCLDILIWPFGCCLRKSFPFEGAVTYGVPLGMYEAWIEENRARFDGMLPPQSQMIRADERMFGDIEQGSWVEGGCAEKDKLV